jgi:hypothetical protein
MLVVAARHANSQQYPDHIKDLWGIGLRVRFASGNQIRRFIMTSKGRRDRRAFLLVISMTLMFLRPWHQT